MYIIAISVISGGYTKHVCMCTTHDVQYKLQDELGLAMMTRPTKYLKQVIDHKDIVVQYCHLRNSGEVQLLEEIRLIKVRRFKSVLKRERVHGLCQYAVKHKGVVKYLFSRENYQSV